MKKLILSVAVAACAAATGLVQAQDEQPKKPATGAAGSGGGAGRANQFTPEDRLKMLTASLGLNQDQQDKIKKILDEGKPEYDKIRALPQEERRPKFRELMQKQNEQIAAVLTPEQKEKYTAAMARRQEQGQGQNRAGGGDANAPKKGDAKPAPEEKK